MALNRDGLSDSLVSILIQDWWYIRSISWFDKRSIDCFEWSILSVWDDWYYR